MTFVIEPAEKFESHHWICCTYSAPAADKVTWEYFVFHRILF